MVNTAAILKVTINTADMLPRIFPSWLFPSILAIEDDMEKNNNGITATKSKFKKMSPNGLMKGTVAGRYRPKRLPTIIPSINNIILL